MSDRPPKLQAKNFATDMPQTITITDVGEGRPWVTSGESQYGEWWMYAVTLNGEKRSFFPSPGLQEAIVSAYEDADGFGAGAQLTICKHDRADGGEGVWWAVGIAGTASEPPGAQPQTAPERTNQKIESSGDKIGGIERMALYALKAARKQLGPDESTEDVRGWASTILIAMQKAGIGPHDFPDLPFAIAAAAILLGTM